MSSLRTAVVGSVLASALLVWTSGPAWARQAGPAAQPPPVSAAAAPAGPAAAIDISEIPVRLQRTAALVRRANAHAQPLGSITEVANSLPVFQSGTKSLLAGSRQALQQQLSVGAALELQNGWTVIAARLARWQALLQQRSVSLQRDLEELAAEREIWTRTRETAASREVPAALEAEVGRTLGDIQNAERVVLTRRNVVLEMQSQIAALSADADEMGELIDASLEAGRGRLFHLNAPPIWRQNVTGSTQPGQEPLQGWSTQAAAEVFQYYLFDVLELVAAETLVFLALAVAFWRWRRHAAAYRVDADEPVRRLGLALGRPFSIALILTVVGSTVVALNAPPYLLGLGWYVAIIPLILVLPRIAAPGIAPFLWGLALLMAAQSVRAFMPTNGLAARVVGLGVALVVCAGLAAYARRVRRWSPVTAWTRLARGVVQTGLALAATAVIGEIAGATDLSRQIEASITSSACGAAALAATLAVLGAAVHLAIRARRPAIRPEPAAASDTASRLSAGLTWLGVVFYVPLLLRAFKVWDLLMAGALRLVRYEVTLGALSFTVGAGFAFLAVLGGAITLSRVARFFLSALLQGRVDVQRGTAEAVAKLAYYSILCVGFFVAVGASGMDLNKFTMLAGALGVGVGLGLQGVVNNFVSGLILLFERPLHVGDTITVGNTSGEVKDIGIRTSTLATWDGADVLIPNASLITDNLVNWTLTDNRRRSEVNVGVAYGTDPARMLGLLRETALAHPLVLHEPAPVTLFTGFGESSLDFSLRFWTLLEHTASVTSDVRVALCARLAAEGIDIPFPTRDVRVTGLDSLAERAD